LYRLTARANVVWLHDKQTAWTTQC